jgi:hypothetical protein
MRSSSNVTDRPAFKNAISRKRLLRISNEKSTALKISTSGQNESLVPERSVDPVWTMLLCGTPFEYVCCQI